MLKNPPRFVLYLVMCQSSSQQLCQGNREGAGRDLDFVDEALEVTKDMEGLEVQLNHK
jgi:hypothetical protein